MGQKIQISQSGEIKSMSALQLGGSRPFFQKFADQAQGPSGRRHGLHSDLGGRGRPALGRAHDHDHAALEDRLGADPLRATHGPASATAVATASPAA